MFQVCHPSQLGPLLCPVAPLCHHQARATQREKWKAIKIKSSYQKSWKFICKCFLSRNAETPSARVCTTGTDCLKVGERARRWNAMVLCFFFNFMACGPALGLGWWVIEVGLMVWLARKSLLRLAPPSTDHQPVLMVGRCRHLVWCVLIPLRRRLPWEGD